MNCPQCGANAPITLMMSSGVVRRCGKCNRDLPVDEETPASPPVTPPKLRAVRSTAQSVATTDSVPIAEPRRLGARTAPDYATLMLQELAELEAEEKWIRSRRQLLTDMIEKLTQSSAPVADDSAAA